MWSLLRATECLKIEPIQQHCYKKVQIRIRYDIFAEYILFGTFHGSKKVQIKINSAKILYLILILQQCMPASSGAARSTTAHPGTTRGCRYLEQGW